MQCTISNKLCAVYIMHGLKINNVDSPSPKLKLVTAQYSVGGAGPQLSV